MGIIYNMQNENKPIHTWSAHNGICTISAPKVFVFIFDPLQDGVNREAEFRENAILMV
jgi:hypothetical protein